MGLSVLCNGMDGPWGWVLALILGVFSPAIQAQDEGKTKPRPPAEIAFAALKPEAIVPVALEPGAAVTTDALWIPQRQSGAVVRIDPKRNAADTPVSVGKTPCASLAVAFDFVWVPLCDGAGVAPVEPKSGNVSPAVPLPVAEPSSSIAVAVGSLWILTDAKGVLSRVDPDTRTVVAETYLAARPSAIAAAEDALWVTNEEGDLLTRVDPHTNVVVETVKVGPRPGRVVVGEGAVWTLNRGDGSVSRVDAKTNKLVTTIAVGEVAASGDIAVGEGSVWISAVGVPVMRIDPRTNRLVQRFSGDGGGAVVVGHGSLWVAAGRAVTWRLDPKLVAAMRPQ
jgi:streptogramin lyase